MADTKTSHTARTWHATFASGKTFGYSSTADQAEARARDEARKTGTTVLHVEPALKVA